MEVKMLTTKRYEYLDIDKIGFHPVLNNHRRIEPVESFAS